jgi:hypothetical protein
MKFMGLNPIERPPTVPASDLGARCHSSHRRPTSAPRPQPTAPSVCQPAALPSPSTLPFASLATAPLSLQRAAAVDADRRRRCPVPSLSLPPRLVTPPSRCRLHRQRPTPVTLLWPPLTHPRARRRRPSSPPCAPPPATARLTPLPPRHRLHHSASSPTRHRWQGPLSLSRPAAALME